VTIRAKLIHVTPSKRMQSDLAYGHAADAMRYKVLSSRETEEYC